MSSNRLIELLQPLVEALGYEFVGLEYQKNPQHALLRIYIDGPEGVGLEDCETVSREVAAQLDVEDPIAGHYNLEVSSPGLDRPLFTPEQYAQFLGYEAKLTSFAPVDGRRKFKGELLTVESDTVAIEVDGETYTLSFDNIAKARLVPDYDALMAERKE